MIKSLNSVTYIYIYIDAYIYIYIYMYIYTYIFIHTYIYTYVHIYMWLRTLHYSTLHYIALHCIALHYIHMYMYIHMGWCILIRFTLPKFWIKNTHKLGIWPTKMVDSPAQQPYWDVPASNQTWQAGISPISGAFDGKIIEVNGGFSSKPRLMTPLRVSKTG